MDYGQAFTNLISIQMASLRETVKGENKLKIKL